MAQDGLLSWLFGSDDDADGPQPQGYVIDTSAIEAQDAERREALAAAGWTEGHARQLSDYCDVFEIPVATTETYPFICLQVLLAMFLIPTDDTEEERNAQCNELRQVMAEHFGMSSESAISGQLQHHQFFRLASQQMTMMQVLPQWFDDLSRSPEGLVTLYKRIKRTLTWMKRIGIGGTGGLGVAATRRAYTEGLRGLREGSGAARGVVRGAAQGATMYGSPTRQTIEDFAARRGISPARGGLAVGVVLVTAMAAYENGERRLELIEDLIEIAYREGRATEEQYMVLFDTIDPDQVNLERYWE